MTDFREQGRKAAEQVLDVARQTQDAAVEAVQAWAETVRRLTPELRARAAVPPAIERLPKSAEFYDDVFDFAIQVLTNQREFTKRLLGELQTAVSAHEAPAEQSATTK